MATTISSGTNPYKLGSPPDFGTLYSGRALTFDGVTDYVDTGATFQSTFRDSFTISMWVKPDDGHPSVYENIFGAVNSPTQDGVYLTIAADGKLDFVYESNDLKAFAKSNSAEFSDGATAWTHMVCVVDNTAEASSIYKNGVLVTLDGTHDGGFDTNSVVMSNFTTGHNLFIGARNNYDTDANHFSGKISNVQVWDKAWTLEDVQWAYTHPEGLLYRDGHKSTNGITLDNLKLWYPCTEGNPRSPQTTVYDGSPKELGSELVTNGTFDTDSSWNNTGSNGWSINTTTKKLVASNVVSYDFVSQDVGITNNGVFLITFDATVDSGECWVTSTDEIQTITSSNSYTLYFTGDGSENGYIYFKGNGFTGTIDNVSVKEVQMGNHGTTTFYETIVEDDCADDGTGDWSVDGSATLAFDTDHYELAINSTNRFCNMGSLSFVAGRTYQIQVDLKDGTATPSDVRLEFRDGADQQSGDIDTTGSFVTNTLTIVAANTTASGAAGFRVISNLSNNNFEFKNFSCKEVGVASGWTTADAEPLIPQTALMGMSKRTYFGGDGNGDYVHSNELAEITKSVTFTVSCWFMVNTVTGIQIIWQNGQGASDRWSLNLNGNALSFENYDGSSYTGLKYTGITAGTLYHALCVSVSNTKTFYLNGSQVTTSATNNESGSSVDHFRLGIDGAGDRELLGIVDEVAIFNANKSSSYQTYFNDGIPYDMSNESSLSYYYRNNVLHTDGKWKDLTESDGTGNNLTVNGSPETILLPEGTTSGKDILGFPLTHTNNGWLNFDGTEYVDIGSSSVINFGEGIDDLGNFGFTYEAWIKLDSSTLTASQGIIGGGADSYLVRINTGNYLIFDNKGSGQDTISTIRITDTNWHHIAVSTHSIDKVTFFLDGDEKDTDTFAYYADTDNTYTIGQHGADGEYFKGSIDEVKIYRKPLSEAEVLKNYNHGKGKHPN